jgi:hypothetical protein
VTFRSESEKWAILTVSSAGAYSLRWSDSKEGSGGSTIDVKMSLYASDRATVVGGILNIDSGYVSPRSVTLAVGDYFLRIGSSTGAAASGTCAVKIYPPATAGELSLVYYDRLLVVNEYAVVHFSGDVVRRLVVTIPATRQYTLAWSDILQGDGTGTVDVVVSLSDESGNPLAPYVNMDSGYSGVPVTLTAGTYHIRVEAKTGLPETGTCAVKAY